MVESLVFILILGLVLYVIYWIAGQFAQGTPLKIIGAVLALVFVIIALQRIGVLGHISGKI
jgi:hypothetical protein